MSDFEIKLGLQVVIQVCSIILNFNFRTGYHIKKEMCITTKSPFPIKRFKRRKVGCRGVLLMSLLFWLWVTILLHKWAKVSNSLQQIVMGMYFFDRQCTSNILKLNANPLNLHSELNFEDDTSSMQRSVNFISKFSCSHLNPKTN